MTSKPDTWMPLYIGDYLRDTNRLTRDQHGAYLLLIMDYWMKGAPPDDARVLGAIVKATRAEWRKLRPVLAPYFDIEDGTWVHGKIEELRTRAAENVERKRAAGARGGEAARGKSGRKKNGKTIAEEIANDIANQIPKELQKNATSPSTSEAPSGAEGARAKDLALFEEICRMLGYNPNDERNFGDFIAILATDSVSRETLLAAAQHHKRAGRAGTTVRYLRPKAIELRDLATVAGPAPVIFVDCDDDEWLGRIRTFERRGIWPPEWGPNLGEAGCRVPDAIQASSRPHRQKESA